MNLTEYSLTLPALPEYIVPRTNWITWIHDRFTPERQAIVIQAPDGAGKTTLLAQFAHHYSAHCFSFFVKPDQYVSTPKLFFQELCMQMAVALRGEEVRLPDNFDDLKKLFADSYHDLELRYKKM